MRLGENCAKSINFVLTRIFINFRSRCTEHLFQSSQIDRSFDDRRRILNVGTVKSPKQIFARERIPSHTHELLNKINLRTIKNLWPRNAQIQ